MVVSPSATESTFYGIPFHYNPVLWMQLKYKKAMWDAIKIKQSFSLLYLVILGDCLWSVVIITRSNKESR